MSKHDESSEGSTFQLDVTENTPPLSQPDNTTDSELREKLAAIEHERWSDWQKWVHSKMEHRNYGVYELDEEVVDAWSKQIETPYAKLKAREKASDLEQVNRYWPLIKEYAAQEANKARLDELIWATGGIKEFTEEGQTAIADRIKQLQFLTVEKGSSDEPVNKP